MKTKIYLTLLTGSFLLFFGLSTGISQDFTWMNGPNTLNGTGVYGMQGVADAANHPPSRNAPGGFTDKVFGGKRLWMYGGFGADANGFTGYYGDLWLYDIETNEWTWMKGTSELDPSIVHGDFGVPNENNTPGGRLRASTWSSADGDLYLFGGQSTGNDRYADVWQYNSTTNNWTWIKGPSSPNVTGVFGEMGVANPDNNPSSRMAAYTWEDNDGNYWIYGGFGTSPDGGQNRLADLWMFDIDTDTWIWMDGVQDPNVQAIYGVQGVPDPNIHPGARNSGVAWTGDDGHLYLFGGLLDGFVRRNDLWRYNIATGEWTWLKGSDQDGALGVIENIGMPGPNDTPGARNGGTGVKDSDGRLWLHGGFSFPTAAGDPGFVNDTWFYDPVTELWNYVKGTPSPGGEAVYGDIGVADEANNPEAMVAIASWFEEEGGAIWLFGGNNSGNRSNTLWRLNGGILEPPSSTKELVEEAPFTIYPNPATNYVLIESTKPGANSEILNIELVDLFGKPIKSFRSELNREISIEGIPAGVYLLRIASDGKTFVKKLIIQ